MDISKNDNEKWLSTKEAAAMMNCSVQNIYKLMTKGAIKFRPAQPFAIDRESLEKYARNRRK